MQYEIPAYMYEKNNTVKMILFTALFALLFINIFQPFGSRVWYPEISDFKYFFFSSIIILTGMLVVVISRVIMLAYSRRHSSITVRQYAAWIAAEIVAMALFYALFAKFVPKEGAERDFMEIFRQSVINTALILLMSYAILWLYFSWQEKNRLLQDLAQEKLPDTTGKLIAFNDEKGEMKISVLLNSLLYIDSADNYVTIHYMNKAKLSQFLIRNSLKSIDQSLSKNTSLVRCHRSYIVNMDNVKVLKKTKEGIMLELNADNAPDIPVSKTYYEQFMHKFSQYSV